MVLNVDGSSLINPENTGYDGLIRKHNGSFQLSFDGSMGIFNILHAEIQALWIEIKLCWEVGYKKLMCYCHSLNVLQLVTKNTPRFHHYANILELI